MADGITEVLNRVRVFYESTSPQEVINSETDQVINDFSELNKNARVSDGFSSEGSYTHDVVLSAFDYIDDVVDDPAFFANNKRFYDFVIEHPPYFRDNADEFGRRSGGWRGIVDMHALMHHSLFPMM